MDGFQGIGALMKLGEDGIQNTVLPRLNVMLAFFEGFIVIFQLLHQIYKLFKLICKCTVVASVMQDSVFTLVSSA